MISNVVTVIRSYEFAAGRLAMRDRFRRDEELYRTYLDNVSGVIDGADLPTATKIMDTVFDTNIPLT